MRRAGRLEAGEFGEREVEILADRLVFLLLAEQFVCTTHTSTSMSITRLQHTLVLIIVIFFQFNSVYLYNANASEACTDRHLRSVQSGLLTVPCTSTNYGDRSFAVHGPRAWNSLPAELATQVLLHCKINRPTVTIIVHVGLQRHKNYHKHME